MKTRSKLVALQMNRLPDINEVVPISKQDEACLQEIEAVLKKYGALSRFGIALLHGHFPINEDEILLEQCDIENRTLMAKPVQRSQVSHTSIETIWRFDDVKGRACERVCPVDKRGKHFGYSDHYYEEDDEDD